MVVIFDTPPALTHAGGLQIAAIVDAVYVVAAAGRTRRSELSELRTQLDNVQAYFAGAIFNRTSRLSLLPAGHGDIATVAVPTGIPGNVKNGAVNPFGAQAPQSNGFPAQGAPQNGALAPQNGAPAPQNGAPIQRTAPVTAQGFATQPTPAQAEASNAAEFANVQGLFSSDLEAGDR